MGHPSRNLGHGSVWRLDQRSSPAENVVDVRYGSLRSWPLAITVGVSVCAVHVQSRGHRGITVIEEQRQVVLGSTALFTKVGQLHIHMIGKRGGRISYLYRQNKGKGIRASGRIRTYSMDQYFYQRKRLL